MKRNKLNTQRSGRSPYSKHNKVEIEYAGVPLHKPRHSEFRADVSEATARWNTMKGIIPWCGRIAGRRRPLAIV